MSVTVYVPDSALKKPDGVRVSMVRNQSP
jgi:hypothetical protein